MLVNPTRSSLLVGLLILGAALPALADDFRDLQLWAPAEVSPYGRGPQPGEGFFFVFDQLYWRIQRPSTQPIGQPGASREVWFGPDDDSNNAFILTNTHDTSLLRSAPLSGSQRFDVGRVIGRWGWFLSTYNLRPQHQELFMSNVHVVFEDPEFGPVGRRFLQGRFSLDPDDPDDDNDNDNDDPVFTDPLDLPVIFDEMRVVNRVEHWSVELHMLHRTRQLHHGGFLEFFGGARYLEFNDRFTATTFPPPDVPVPDPDPDPDNDNDNDNGNGNGNPTGVLDHSFWDTRAENNVIGPQIGMRWFRQHGRLRVSAEGRFLAGLNHQNIAQSGILGSEIDPTTVVNGQPFAVASQGFRHREHSVIFSPAVEVRANAHFQFTRAVSLKAGWTGFWIDSIARGSAVTDYRVNDLDGAAMGIDMGRNRQHAFAHGLNIGVEVNR